MPTVPQASSPNLSGWAPQWNHIRPLIHKACFLIFAVVDAWSVTVNKYSGITAYSPAGSCFCCPGSIKIQTVVMQVLRCWVYLSLTSVPKIIFTFNLSITSSFLYSEYYQCWDCNLSCACWKKKTLVFGFLRYSGNLIVWVYYKTHRGVQTKNSHGSRQVSGFISEQEHK